MSKKKKTASFSLASVSSLYQQFLKRMYLWVMLLVAFPVFIIVLALFWWFSSPNPAKTNDLSSILPPRLKPEQQEIIPTLFPTPRMPAPLAKDFVATQAAYTARALIAVDVGSEAVLFAKDEKLQLWPASTTKVMTALVALDEYSLDDIVVIQNPIAEGSRMGLVHGERITVEYLLYGMLVQSANDAAYAIAQHHPGGRTAFIDLMNQKSQEIGLENTHFYDPAGFDNDKQFTTASDLSKLALYALKNKTVAKIVATPLITVSDVDYLHFHQLRNVNQLLGQVPGVAGVKTGWTENAKENLINLTRRNGQSVLTVVLGSEDRFGETQRLTNWVFNNYEWLPETSD